MQLRDWLEKSGLTQEALGQRMNPPVSQGKVSHWLNGTRRVSLAEGLQVVAITGGDVSMEELAAMYRARPAAAAAAQDEREEVRDAA